MTKTITVSYLLTETGRKAAILADRPATREVTEAMQAEVQPALLDLLTLGSDGRLTLPIPSVAYPYANTIQVALDAPPHSVEDLAAHYADVRTRLERMIQEEAARKNAARAEEEARERAKVDADRAIVEAALASLEAGTEEPNVKIDATYTGAGLQVDGRRLTLDSTAQNRLTLVAAARRKAEIARKEAEKQAREAAKQKKKEDSVRDHGGYLFDGGMTGFSGYGLWDGGGTEKRWVGVFSAVRGIDRFLDNPRGEHRWDVSDLRPGECIQGGAYDQDRRGRRRNEIEWFGKVTRNDDSGLVIKPCKTRSEALKK